MRWSWLVALGAGAYLAFAIASLPAATAYHWFAPDALRLSGIGGTAWSGSAALGSVPGLPMRDLRWRIEAGPLLLGRLSGRFEARLPDGFVDTRAVASLGSTRLEDAQASTTLAALRGILPLGDSRGQVSVALERLVLVDGWPVEAVGTVRIADLAVPPLMSTSDRLIDIGSFVVELTGGAEPGISGTIDDTGGPLEIENGMLSLGPDRRYLLSGLARPRPNASQELAQGVTMMTGEPDSEGLRPFEFPGSL